MIWQDVVIAIAQWMFIIALLPSIRSEDKPALATSVMTGALLFILAFTYATISLFMASASIGVLGLVWFVLAFQKYRQDAKKHEEKTVS